MCENHNVDLCVKFAIWNEWESDWIDALHIKSFKKTGTKWNDELQDKWLNHRVQKKIESQSSVCVYVKSSFSWELSIHINKMDEVFIRILLSLSPSFRIRIHCCVLYKQEEEYVVMYLGVWDKKSDAEKVPGKLTNTI